MLQKSPREAYTRRLRTEWVMPSHIGERCRFNAAANVQSSINAPRIAAKPPIRRNASVRTSMQPPPRRRRLPASLLHANG